MYKYLFLIIISVIFKAISFLCFPHISNTNFLFVILLNMFFVCVTAGLLFLASKYRDNVLRGVKNLCHSLTNHHDNKENEGTTYKKYIFSLDKIILADSPEKCDYAVQRIRRNLCNGVLGFDCEWVNEGRVSLLQLATYNGVCALFRLGKIGYVPPMLKELLANNCILKVGVASFEDGKKLTKDYGCRVFGTLDLRNLADVLGLPNRKSLAALCMQYLGIELEKIIEVRCGNWDADTLTDEQISYAAYDAVASVLIYHEMQRVAKRQHSILRDLVFFIKSIYNWGYRYSIPYTHDVPSAVVDVKFRGSPDLPLNKKVNPIGSVDHNKNTYNQQDNVDLNKDLCHHKKNNDTPPNNGTDNDINNKNTSFDLSLKTLKVNRIPTRKEPLYDNCYLQAPDGETLCTCDRKKAEWYVNKGLGLIVIEEPLTVRLSFEPSGRAHGQVGQYYTQIKVNQCVVCGSQDKFIKKNVVPREYRKYFPVVMKAHQSHDVLLLCPTCHEISNKHDLDLRRHLASICDAPLSRPLPPITRNDHNHHKRKLFSAVKALQMNPSLPLHRRKELEARVLEYSSTIQQDTTQVNNENIGDKISLKSTGPKSLSSPLQAKVTSHGLKVVDYFINSDCGLVALETMWREHFLATMRPKHLPKLWSVSHNQERLKIRCIENRIEPQDVKVAGLKN